MKNLSQKIHRFALTLIVFFGIFGNLFPFLNIDMGFVILTPIRSILFLISLYSLFIWYTRFKTKEAINILKNNRIDWLVFAFFAVWFVTGALWIVLGDTNSYAPTEVVSILTTCLLAFCIFTLVRNDKDVSFLLKLFVFCGILLSILACAELVVGNFVPNTKFNLTLEEKIQLKITLFPPTTVFHNPNDFAAFMLLCLSIVSFWMVRAKKAKTFCCYLIMAVLLTVPVVFCGSTLYNLFLSVVTVVTVLLLLFNSGKNFKKRILQTTAVVSVFLFFSLFGINVIRSAVIHLNRNYYSVQIEKYYESLNPPQGDPDDPTQGEKPPMIVVPDVDFSHIENPDTLKDQIVANQNNYGTIHIRLWLLRAGWDFFLDNPLIGGGPESFRYKISQNNTYLEQTRGNTNPHFFYMELLSQYGILLFTVYITIVLYLIIRSLCVAVRELRDGQIGRGCLCLLLLGTFSAVVIMPSSVIRFTSLWLFFLLSICVFSKFNATDTKTQ